ncbi:MAG: protein YgfX [Thiohalomonadaceae bacterium]
MPSTISLHLAPVASRRLWRIVLVAHIASGLLLLWLATYFSWPGLFLPLIWISYRYYIRHIQPLINLAHQGNGGWLWYHNDGTAVPVHILPETLLTPWLVLLRVREEGGRRHSLPILADSLSTEDFRALRVALRQEQI